VAVFARWQAARVGSLQAAAAPQSQRSPCFPIHDPTPHPGATAQAHFESKHPSLPWDESKATDLHAITGGVTTQGVAVRGSKKK